HEIAGSHEGATYLGPWTHQPGVLATSHAVAPPGDGFARLDDAASGAQTVIGRGALPIVLDLDRTNRLALVRRGPRGKRTVWAVDIRTGVEEQLLPAGGYGSTDLGRLSPDARVAYVRSDAGREAHALFAVHLATPGSPQRAAMIAGHDDGDLEHVDLTSDGRTAVLLWNVEGRSACEIVDLATGERVALPLPEPVAHDGSFSGDGRWLAMTLEGPIHPRAVWLFDTGARSWRRMTHQSPAWSAPTAQPTLERLRADDDLALSGWLYQAAAIAGKPRAAVVWRHGGPEAQERPTYSPLFQELVARGVAVFAANVRGSSGFGRSFVEADNRDKRWAAIADVAACVRHLIRLGVASPQRVACAGRSYGGYLTLASLVFHPDLFAAGVDVCGMADFHTFYANTEPWIAQAAYPKYGHPVHDAALLRALSPVHRFDALRAPLLVVHGENDSNVPLEEALQVVEAARRRGVPVDFLPFADEGHEIARPDNRELFVRATVDWLVDRLLGTIS
ncbi:MAG TPA: prolyl oligopeptidase family serine peptidase, partial [Polyangiaceae bacterium]|nr:prolyl oligopeptidase family serine peptidase [Polyangiaceae bacterium]